jgi:hypothetical protein
MLSGFLKLYFTLAWFALQVFGDPEKKSRILAARFLVHSNGIWR